MMKNIIALFLFCCSAMPLFSQDSTRTMELGTTLLNIGSKTGNYAFPEKGATFQFLNGVLLKYNFNRFAVRGMVMYHTDHTTFSPPPNTADYMYTELISKDLKFGLGEQYTFSERKDRSYVFFDACYRKLNTQGSSSGGITGETYWFKYDKKGVEASAGLGMKLKILKGLFLTPELGINCFSGKQALYRSSVNGKYAPEFTNFFETTPFGKLHLVAQF
jgi:hypothetical protein